MRALLSVALLAAAAGCAFDAPSGVGRCKLTGDCPDGALCYRGYCLQAAQTDCTVRWPCTTQDDCLGDRDREFRCVGSECSQVECAAGCGPSFACGAAGRCTRVCATDDDCPAANPCRGHSRCESGLCVRGDPLLDGEPCVSVPESPGSCTGQCLAGSCCC